MRRNHLLFAGAFTMNLNLTMLGLSLVYFLADKFGQGAGMIGLFFALGYGTYFLGCTLYHRWDDKIRPAGSLISAAALIAFLSLGLYFSPRFGLALGALLLLQGSLGFFWPPLMGWVSAGLEGKELGRNLGQFNQSWSTGALLGPFVAGWLYPVNPILPFAVSASSLLLIALLFILGSRILPDMNPADTLKAKKEAPAGIDKSTPLRFPSWVGIFSSYAVYGVVVNILPLEIRDSLGYGEQTAGNLLLLRGIVTLAGFTLLARHAGWHFKRSWIMAVQLITTVLVSVVLLLPSRLGFLGGFILLFGLLYAASYNNSIFHGSSGAVNRGRRMAIHEAVLTMGVASGSLGGGVLYQWGGVDLVWFFLLLIQAGGLLAMGVLMMRKTEVPV
jgi:DHA1 family multidrug resistance protein-like MFS transporter/DHA1 family quinolone resistance protein-like MFS transporter